VDLAYFALLIGVLIFIHELGHFAFAKFFGVKVLTFSIGFGPKLLRLRGRETEYCLAVLPFGGFVKMLEEGKGSGPIPPEDRRRTFEAQALWKRILIVLAGPAMNLFFPVVLYTSVFLEHRLLPPPVVGVVFPGMPADGKLQPGDRIEAIDGEPVATYPDVQRLLSGKAGSRVTLVVTRDGREIGLDVTPVRVARDRDREIEEDADVLGFLPGLPAPVIGVPSVDSPAYRSGLRTFDRIVSIGGRRVGTMRELMQILADNRGDTVTLSFMRPIPVGSEGGLFDLAVMEPGVATLTPMPRVGNVALDGDVRAKDVADRAGIETAEMYVAFVPEASSEWKAGLRPGDRVTHLDGVPQRLWLAMKEDLKRGASQMRELRWTRDGEPKRGFFQLRREVWQDEYAQNYERYVFRTTHWAPRSIDLVPNPSPITYAVRSALEETGSVIRFLSVGFVRIAQGRVSLKSVSGPITLYDVAGQAGAKGTTYFVWAMAVISINLGLVNLLPIPVLDGGHLAFLALEAVKKRPVSLRAREIASLVGMSMLMLLMMVAFKNDVERRWEVILGQIRELFG
jgi:regulator of sigma E protease